MTSLTFLRGRSRPFIALALAVITGGGMLLFVINGSATMSKPLRLALNGFVCMTFVASIFGAVWLTRWRREVDTRSDAECESMRLRTRLEVVLSYTSNTLLTVDGAGIVREADGEALAPRGTNIQALVGGGLLEAYPDQQRFADDVRTCLKEQRAISTTVRVRDRSFEVHCRPRRLPTGQIDGFYAVANETTARREAEEEVRRLKAVLTRSREELRLFRDESTVGTALFDRSGRLVEANKAFCSALGYPEEDLVGRLPEDLVDQGDIGRSMQLTLRLREGGESRGQIEVRFVRRDGTSFDGLVSATAWRTPTGEVDRVLMQVRDITVENEAKRSLEAAQRALAVILAAADDAVLVLDGDGRVVAMSAGFAEFIGVAPAEMMHSPGAQIEKRIRQCEPEQDDVLERWFAGESNLDADLVLRSPTERCYSIASRILPDGRGRLMLLRPRQLATVSPTLVLRRVSRGVREQAR